MTWTDAEVRWAAKNLRPDTSLAPPYYVRMWDSDDSLTYGEWRTAITALDHGYVPPPKPPTVREELCELILRDAPKAGGWEKDAADAILSKFRVERKTDEP